MKKSCVLLESLFVLGLFARPAPLNVPDLLTMTNGTKITTRADWESKRAPEIRQFFVKNYYGRRPVERPPHLVFTCAEPDKVMMDGAALRKRVRCEYGGKFGTNAFVFTAFIPMRVQKPAPSFILICNRDPKENIDPERIKKSEFWPAEEIVERGYAALAFWNGDITPDRFHGRTLGCYAAFEDVDRMYRGSDGWGVLSAWAWGASRVLDWIETEPRLDAKHVGVVGHSRGGKTALVAGVMDARFAMACSNCSGCGGAKLNHMDLPKAEYFWHLARSRPFWFCPNWMEWVRRDQEMPFDQHEWVALMAPRLVCIASASKDDWAGQQAEFQTARLASPAWELYGQKGLVGNFFPPVNTPLQDGCISYHYRDGIHNLTVYDWNCYMDFADRHGWRK